VGLRLFRQLLKLVLICILGLGILQFRTTAVYAQTFDDLQKQIDDLNNRMQLLNAAITPNENQLKDLDSRITKIRGDIQVAQVQANNDSQTIAQREVQLASQYQIFTQRVMQTYKRTFFDSPLLTLLSNSDATHLTLDLTYRAAAEKQDNKLIHQTGSQIQDLEQQKSGLVARQKQLTALTTQLNTQANSLQALLQNAYKYRDQLTGQIAALTAQQKAILDARSGSVTTSVGDVPPADDFNASIAFKPQAPSDSFAVFAFGAYTHRKGLSQYGAKGRAMSGQSYKDILQAYFGKQPENRDTGGTISVAGIGRINFETTYMYGIAEMPSSYPMEALKAQAVAARTFAYRYEQSGQTICAGDGCPGQVFLRSKSNNPPDGWKQAVNQTRGQIVPDVVGFFSSTTGGYANPVGWDTKCGNQSCWTGDAYEKIANSPWFYRSWYRLNYYNSSSSCGRNHPWLSQQEFSDIINAWIVRKNPNGADASRIQPITINQCHVGGSGGNPYSMDELRDFANKSGGAVTHVNSVSVSNSNAGVTTNVHLDTNRGGLDIPGSEFKSTFNLRAPGYMSIPQNSFSFFNVEYKS